MLRTKADFAFVFFCPYSGKILVVCFLVAFFVVFLVPEAVEDHFHHCQRKKELSQNNDFVSYVIIPKY